MNKEAHSCSLMKTFIFSSGVLFRMLIISDHPRRTRIPPVTTQWRHSLLQPTCYIVRAYSLLGRSGRSAVQAITPHVRQCNYSCCCSRHWAHMRHCAGRQLPTLLLQGASASLTERFWQADCLCSRGWVCPTAQANQSAVCGGRFYKTEMHFYYYFIPIVTSK